MTDGAFAEWLKRKLELRGENASEFAIAIGKHPSVVGRWLRSERNPDPQSCDLVADELRVDRDVVLAIAGHRPAEIELAKDDPRRDLIASLNRLRMDGDAKVLVGGVKTMIDGLLVRQRS